MRRIVERLQDILEAIDAIDRYTQQGKAVFESQELVQVWVLRRVIARMLETIAGEP